VRALISKGALWNLFILGGTVRSMLALFSDGYAEAVSTMRAALARDRLAAPTADCASLRTTRSHWR
jgi:hypothetical protein